MDVFLHLLSQYGYVALFFLVLAGGTYIPIPGGVALIAAGTLAHHHYFSLSLSFLVALTASLSEDVVTYAITHRIGNSKRWLAFVEKNRYADLIERNFKKKPGLVVIVSRFIGFTSVPVNALAGLSRMSVLRFIGFAALGNGICTAFYLAVGYGLGYAWGPDLQITLRVILGMFIGAMILYLLFFFISEHRNKPYSDVSP